MAYKECCSNLCDINMDLVSGRTGLLEILCIFCGAICAISGVRLKVAFLRMFGSWLSVIWDLILHLLSFCNENICWQLYTLPQSICCKEVCICQYGWRPVGKNFSSWPNSWTVGWNALPLHPVGDLSLISIACGFVPLVMYFVSFLDFWNHLMDLHAMRSEHTVFLLFNLSVFTTPTNHELGQNTVFPVHAHP